MIISGGKRGRGINSRDGSITENGIIEPKCDSRFRTLLASSFKGNKN
jgi:hypothetical protein